MENRKYNVDDILAEVRAKRERRSVTGGAAPENSPRPSPAPPAAEKPGAGNGRRSGKTGTAETAGPEEKAAGAGALTEAALSGEDRFRAPRETPSGEPDSAPPESRAGSGAAPEGNREPGAFDPKRAREECRPVLDRLTRQGKGLAAGLAAGFFLLLATVYLALSETFRLPLPDFLASDASLRVWVMVALTAVSALCSGGTMGNGLIALFTAGKSNDAYVALTVFACLLQGSFLAVRPDLLERFSASLYLPLAAAVLFFHAWGKLIRNAGQRQICECISQSPPVEPRFLDGRSGISGWAAGLPEKPESVLCLNPAARATGQEDELNAVGPAEALSGVMAPITAAAALVMAVVFYFVGDGDLYTSATIFTAALCVTSPFAASIGSQLPLKRFNRGLAGTKSSYLGSGAAEQLAKADAVLLRCSDLFPPGSVTLHSVKTYDKKPLDKALVHAASVFCRVDSTLTPVFRNMIDSADILRPVENTVLEEGLGISAWVDSCRVLIGNRGLLEAHGIEAPPAETEEQMRRDGREIIYLSNLGALTAGFIVSYRPDRCIARQLRKMERNGIAILLHASDPGITPELAARTYGLAPESVHVLPAALHREAESALAARETVPASFVSGSVGGSLGAMLSAPRCVGVFRAVTMLLTLSVILGFGLLTFLAYSHAVGVLTWPAIGIYQLFWLLITLLVTLPKK